MPVHNFSNIADADVLAVDNAWESAFGSPSFEPLATNESGDAAWLAAKKSYDRRIDRVESDIIRILRDQLSGAGTGASTVAMFGAFERFNVLFFRPRIRGAVQHFQGPLIDLVKRDIAALQDVFRSGYGGSNAALMTSVACIPPASGAIVWAKQIEKQLRMCMKRGEMVLGHGWEDTLEGKELRRDVSNFLRKLDGKRFFENWCDDVKAWISSESGPIFDAANPVFVVSRAPSSSTSGPDALELKVTYSTKVVALFQEVSSLAILGYGSGEEGSRLPTVLRSLAEDAHDAYPYAMSLQSSLATFHRVHKSMQPHIRPLVSHIVDKVHYRIEAAFRR